jgi:hypothetical protein
VPLTDTQQELVAIKATLTQHVFDPVWVAVAQDVGAPVTKNPGEFGETLTDVQKEALGVYGILHREGTTDVQRTDKFSRALAISRAEYRTHQQLFKATLAVLVKEGGDGHGEHTLSAKEWASTVQALAQQRVAASDPLIGLKTRTALAGITVQSGDAPPSTVQIDLPDLEAETDSDIQQDNLQAAQAIYYAAALEDVRMFQVVDKLVELFERGMLPIGKGRAGDLLYAYWRKSSTRMSEVERRNLYARVLGFPGGDASAVMPNRDFSDLWLRCLSGVASMGRQFTVDDLLRASIPASVSQEGARKAARDLAANLSLHAYGMAYFAAIELQQHITEIIAILSDEEVKTAYGARDMWQVIDQVATLELGGARNSVRYRTLATAGAIIIRWLANHADLLRAGTTKPLIDLTELRLAGNPSSLHKPMVSPTMRDFVDSCEQWLAVTGTQDTQVEQYAQPVEGPSMTSRPVAIPEAARDVMAQFGINGVAVGA